MKITVLRHAPEEERPKDTAEWRKCIKPVVKVFDEEERSDDTASESFTLDVRIKKGRFNIESWMDDEGNEVLEITDMKRKCAVLFRGPDVVVER